jgi:hypothetical protein
MLGGKGKGGRVGQRESPSGTEVSPCLRVANLQKIFFIYLYCVWYLYFWARFDLAAGACVWRAERGRAGATRDANNTSRPGRAGPLAAGYRSERQRRIAIGRGYLYLGGGREI